MPLFIDRTTWPRRHHLAFFETFAQPHFCITREVDASRLWAALETTPHKPFAAMLHATTRACNEEEVFRLRLRWPEAVAGSSTEPAALVLHDVVHPSFTARVDPVDPSAPGCDLPLFAYATARYCPSFPDFAERVAAVSQAVRHDPDLVAHAAADTDDLVFVSSLPWMSYTAVSHAMLDPTRDCTPRVMWGRIEPRGGRKVLSVSVQVHHGLADGGHVARWFRRLQARLDEPDWLAG